jgi:hypothetical protein
MTPSAKETVESLLAYIQGRFEEGLTVGEDGLHFIDSTLSNPTSKEIAAILQDERHPERDSLLDLIFYPDLDLQIGLENLLKGRSCSEKDYRSLRSALGDAFLTTVIHFADGRESISVTASQRLIDAFLQRLNLTRDVSGRILQAVEKTVSQADRPMAVVRLRNARRVSEENALGFLGRYIERMYPDPMFWDGLDFTLSFLEQVGADTDIYEALMLRKMRCLHTLKEIDRYEDKRRSDNIETLMLRGERFPHADRQEVTQSIAIIDRIAMAIYGKTDGTPPAAGVTQSHRAFSEKDLKALIRLFSEPHKM